MPESSAHTKLRRDTHMRQKKYGRYLRLYPGYQSLLRLKLRLRAFEDALMELEIELFEIAK